MARSRAVIERRAKIIDHMGGKCQICGFDSYTGALDLHHIDPKTKSPDFGRLYNAQIWPWARVLRELDLCQLVCANCHRLLHTIVGRNPRRDRYPARRSFADFAPDTNVPEGESYSVLEVAKKCRVSEQIVRNEIVRGNLEASKFGSRKYRITKAQFDEWIVRCTTDREMIANRDIISAQESLKEVQK